MRPCIKVYVIECDKTRLEITNDKLVKEIKTYFPEFRQNFIQLFRAEFKFDINENLVFFMDRNFENLIKSDILYYTDNFYCEIPEGRKQREHCLGIAYDKICISLKDRKYEKNN
jgi:hypothetical protein